MARLVFSDMPKGLLSAGLTDTDTTVAVQAGQGERFPAIVAPEVSWGYLFDGAGHYEKVKVTAHTGGADAFTVERGQGGTTARAWVAGNGFDLRLTVDGLAMLAQTADLQSGAATWATGVAGTADAIVLTFDPPIAAYSDGMPLRFQAVSANTGPATVQVDGLAAVGLTRLDGAALAVGDIGAGDVVEMVYVAGGFRAAVGQLPTRDVILDGPDNTNVYFQHNGVNRWVIYRDNTDGGLKVLRLDSGGTGLDNPLEIREDGVVLVNGKFRQSGAAVVAGGAGQAAIILPIAYSSADYAVCVMGVQAGLGYVAHVNWVYSQTESGFVVECTYIPPGPGMITACADGTVIYWMTEGA